MIITVEDLINQLEQFETAQMVYIALDGSEGAGLFSVEPHTTETHCEDLDGNSFDVDVVGLYPQSEE